MRVVGNLADRKRSEASADELGTDSRENSSKKGRRRQKRSESMPTVVQRLFDTCKEVFDGCGPGIIPSPEGLSRLQSILDKMKPSDVGLTPKMPYLRSSESRRTPRVTYIHLYECANFSIGIFCLPPSGVIPLHNHPGMTVFSKLLFGSMHIKSYDWVDDAPLNANEMIKPVHVQDRNVRLAKVQVDAVFTAPCDTSILYPAAGGNMHCFTAKTSCAVLDVLGPPYDDSDRPCTYYNDIPITTDSGDSASVPCEEGKSYAWLEERERNPDDFSVDVAQYKGPKIVER